MDSATTTASTLPRRTPAKTVASTVVSASTATSSNSPLALQLFDEQAVKHLPFTVSYRDGRVHDVLLELSAHSTELVTSLRLHALTTTSKYDAALIKVLSRFTNLRVLELSDCLRIKHAADLISALCGMHELRKLDLSNGHLTDVGEEDCTALAHLTSLSFANNVQLRGKSFSFSRLLGDGSSLCTLDLSRCKLRAAGAQRLVDAVRAHHASPLRRLLLDHCKLGDEGAAQLGSLLDEQHGEGSAGALCELSIAGNSLGEAGCTAVLAHMRGGRGLRWLRIGEQPLGKWEQCAEALGEALLHGRLEHLDLQRTGITAAFLGQQTLHKALGHSASLTHLLLADNRLGAEGCGVLADALLGGGDRCRVRHLDLSGCDIGDDAFHESILLRLLNDRHMGGQLTCLRVAKNSLCALTAPALRWLEAPAEWTAIRELDLSDNRLEYTSLMVLAKWCAQLGHLASLNLARAATLTHQEATELMELCTRCRRLQRLSVGPARGPYEGVSPSHYHLIQKCPALAEYTNYNAWVPSRWVTLGATDIWRLSQETRYISYGVPPKTLSVPKVTSLLVLGNFPGAAAAVKRRLADNWKQASRLWEACRVGDTAAISTLLACGVSVYAGEPDTGNTPLHIAAASGNVDALLAVLRSRRWVNTRCLNKEGLIPYEVAVRHGYGDRFRSLLDNSDVATEADHDRSAVAKDVAREADHSAMAFPAPSAPPPQVPAAAASLAASSKKSKKRASKGKDPLAVSGYVDWKAFSALADRVATLLDRVDTLEKEVAQLRTATRQH